MPAVGSSPGGTSRPGAQPAGSVRAEARRAELAPPAGEGGPRGSGSGGFRAEDRPVAA